MRKLSLLLAVFASVGLLMLSSCGEDEVPTQAPNITVNPSNDTIYVKVGDTLKYQLTWNCPDDILSAKISYKSGTNSNIVLDTTLPAGTKSFAYNLNIGITDQIPEGTIFQFDFFGNSKDQSTIVTSYIKVVSALKTYTGVTMQAQADGPDTYEKNLTFYSTSLNQLYTLKDAENDSIAQNIDIVFTHHSLFKTNAELSFKSPDYDSLYIMWHEFGGFDPPYEYDTTNKNRTYFKKVTLDNWDNLTNSQLEEIVGEIGTNKKVKDINTGDYTAFETENGKKGILKITGTQINHNPYNDTFVTFDVKVQR